MRNLIAGVTKFRFAAPLAIAFASSFSATQSTAQTQPELAARGQQIAGSVCVACHGADGNSAVAANPHLAAQGEQYIARQLAAFKSGARASPIMSGMAANLAPEDMKSLGVWFSRQKATQPAVARDKALAEAGQKIFRGGIRKTDVPACAGCHSANGAGIPALNPRLAGQWPEYTLAQLQAFAGDQRKHPVMSAIAKRMTDSQMKQVAEYVAGMR